MSILKGNNEKMAASSGNRYYVVFVSYIRVTQSLLYVAGWFLAFFSAFHLRRLLRTNSYSKMHLDAPGWPAGRAARRDATSGLDTACTAPFKPRPETTTGVRCARASSWGSSCSNRTVVRSAHRCDNSAHSLACGFLLVARCYPPPGDQ